MPPRPRPYFSARKVFRLPHLATPQPSTVFLAIRVWNWSEFAKYGGGLGRGILIGKSELILERSDDLDYVFAWNAGGRSLLGMLEALAGLASLAFFLLRPKEKDYGWFCALLLLSAVSRGIEVNVSFHPVAVLERNLIQGLLSVGGELASVAFYYHFLRGKRNWILWSAIGFIAVYLCLLPTAYTEHLGLDLAASLEEILFLPAELWILGLLTRRAIQGQADARLLLIPVLIQQLLGLADGLSSLGLSTGWFNLNVNWLYIYWRWPFNFRLYDAADALFLLGVLAVLIYRFTRTSRQEDEHHREREAARTVQQVLIPHALPTIPGFAIASVYKPFGEVGGDFFQILPVASGSDSGSVILVIGDVSGKGLPAAMLVSLIVGALRALAETSTSPAQLLTGLNRLVLGRSGGGFTTCLILRADPGGALTVANAGHICPYLDGQELFVDAGLPLGLTQQAIYPESTFHLAFNQQFTLVTDGVVEARNATGELYGFDRTAALSKQSAEEIARAAQHFGQDDDITALTLSRVPHMTPA